MGRGVDKKRSRVGKKGGRSKKSGFEIEIQPPALRGRNIQEIERRARKKKEENERIKAYLSEKREAAIARVPPQELREKKILLKRFLRHISDFDFLDRAEIANFERYIDDAVTITRLTDVHGEIVMAQFIRQCGGTPLGIYKPGAGIDGLVIVSDGENLDFYDEMSRCFFEVPRRPSSRGKSLPEKRLFVIETKGPNANLGSADGYGPQMSAQWVANNLRANTDTWNAVDENIGLAELSRKADLSRGGHSESDRRIRWVMKNTIPLLIRAHSIDGDDWPEDIGTCEVLSYNDQIEDEDNTKKKPGIIMKKREVRARPFRDSLPSYGTPRNFMAMAR